MSRTSFFEAHFRKPFAEFVQLNHEQRASAVRSAVPDLNVFIETRPIAQRDAPERSKTLARSLFKALSQVDRHGAADEALLASLEARIVTDEVLRTESDRDQNVYLGPLFTRRLTRAVPDVIVQPASLGEACAVFRWSRDEGVPVTLRGAASTAMGGSVPNDGGVTIDLSRLDVIDIDPAGRVCVIGAGARLRDVHRKLASRGLALRAYPSNLGGTLTGWFVTGGIGLNAFTAGHAVESVRAADVILPEGDHLRFHADGRLDVPGGHAGHRTTLTRDAAMRWFKTREIPPLKLENFAGSEGALGLVIQLTVSVEPRPEIAAFLLAFGTRNGALEAADWVARSSHKFPSPANLKLFSASHMDHVRHVWQDEDARDPKGPSALVAGEHLPWTRIIGPAELGARTGAVPQDTRAYLFVDFQSVDAARAFVGAMRTCPGKPTVIAGESERVAAERFRPQQTKRLGPGLLAAEILMPAKHLKKFLPAAQRLAAGIGVQLDAEVYFLGDGSSLVIAEYLTDHRRGTFAAELPLAPALVDLAMTGFEGRPYVLGRWQSAYFTRRFGPGAPRVLEVRKALDPNELVNRGVLTRMRLHGSLGRFLGATFVPGIGLLRRVYGSPLTSWLARTGKAMLGAMPGPSAGRGEPAAVGARFRVAPLLETQRAETATNGKAAGSILLAIPPALGDKATAPVSRLRHGAGPGDHDTPLQRTRATQTPEDRAIHCVNCGECNVVCPIFNESKIRLPQMLTHLGEAMRGGEGVPETGSTLLDLCMRCGNCEEVCQAGIPHLPLYERMQKASDSVRPKNHERHAAIVATVRSSSRYRDDFLKLRGGMYLRRSPASLPGVPRFVVMRTENDAGPASTCIHCGACVPVCPTNANREFEGADPRWITTVQDRCIGCGSCVEVCPANLSNGGRTLRVMEAPTPNWFVALDEFNSRAGPAGARPGVGDRP